MIRQDSWGLVGTALSTTVLPTSALRSIPVIRGPGVAAGWLLRRRAAQEQESHDPSRAAQGWPRAGKVRRVRWRGLQLVEACNLCMPNHTWVNARPLCRMIRLQITYYLHCAGKITLLSPLLLEQGCALGHPQCCAPGGGRVLAFTGVTTRACKCPFYTMGIPQ